MPIQSTSEEFIMTKRLLLLIIVALCGPIMTAHAQKPVRVIILPFKVHAPQELNYLQSEIPLAMEKNLQQENATIVKPDVIPESLSQGTAVDVEEVRQFAQQHNSDFIIWGGLTWIDQQFSLDVKMLNPFGTGPPSAFFEEGQGVENLAATAFFEEGQGVENLAATVEKMTTNLGLTIFKRAQVLDVRIEGNNRIEPDAIRNRIKSKPGDVYSARAVSNDLKSIYDMGYFEDIRVETEDETGGKILIFKVEEKPTIRDISFRKNDYFDDDELMENLSIKAGSILNIYKIRSNIKRIEELYKEKNFHNVRVTYNVNKRDNNQADIEFIVAEGEKVHIKEIRFEGNETFTDKELRKEMQTKEKGFFWWLTSSGELNMDNLTQDVSKLAAFYHNNGYIKARVGEPAVDYDKEGIYITIKVVEGDRYKVGDVTLTGDMVRPKEQLLPKIRITEEEYFNREVVRNDILAITEIYSDEGYAYVNVTPILNEDADKLTVNIAYDMKKGRQVYFEKILISGNTKTRDKVIRRELRIYEQELYSGERLKRGIRNLHRLDFFEDIKVDTIKGSDDDKMIVKIEVTEKPTGSFSFGGGYSSVEDLFVMASISQRNLFGRGQVLSLRAELGGVTNRYTLSFTEPWLFDKPISAGFDIFNWDRDYETYEKSSIGGSVRTGYRLYDYTRFYLTYFYENADVSNISEDAADSIKELEGKNVTSAVTGTIRYDSRDRVFNPTQGQNHMVSIEYAGLGGDIGFTKYLAELGLYIPLFWGTVGFLHTEGGYVEKNGNGLLPDYERFYLGGINSVRGFEWQDIFAVDENGDIVGGNSYIQFNVEYIFPIIKEAGVMGLIFFDAGQVYGENESIDLGQMRESAGFGIRWYSPMGPLRVEYGYKLDRRDGEDQGRWDFAIGAGF
jgi:outer membrane protein insertion porin family